MEVAGFSMLGVYRDILMDGAERRVHDSGWRKNTIVDRGRQLLAGFIKNGPSDGLQFLAVGQGSSYWDAEGPPAYFTSIEVSDGRIDKLWVTVNPDKLQDRRFQ